LSNMNLVVNQKGELQFMRAAANTDEQEAYAQQPQQSYPQQSYPSRIQVKKEESLDPSLKHSYIYNKYFKDYRDSGHVPEKKVPKTREEYRRMVLEERIKRIEHYRRISQIKSKKLLFENADKIKATDNKLRKMNFY